MIKQKEHQIQATLIAWWHVAHRGLGVPDHRLLMMIPNGAYFGAGRSARGVPLAVIRSAQMKRQGMVSGAPDLCLAVMRGGFGALWIELKTETGAIRPEQRELHALLIAQGYRVVIPRSFDEAVSAITQYLELNVTTTLTAKQQPAEITAHPSGAGPEKPSA